MVELCHIFKAELKRYFATEWSHLGDNLSWFMYLFFVFGAVLLVLSGLNSDGFGSENQLLVMVGWVSWMVARSGMEKLPLIISGEAKTGTLEQICLVPISLATLLMVRSLAYLLGIGIRGIVAAAILLFLIQASLSSTPVLMLLFLVSLGGVYGLGFLFAGLALVVKRVNALTGLVFSLMIFFTGAFVGLEKFSRVFEILKYVFPLTWEIHLMRAVISGEATWLSLNRSGELLALILHSTAYFVLGLLIFGWGYRTARRKGILAHY